MESVDGPLDLDYAGFSFHGASLLGFDGENSPLVPFKSENSVMITKYV
ncbi:hypothetical protein A2U01_0064332, partial [Trifolium medium]|nr:hypothetical protein [Trifolium medium]